MRRLRGGAGHHGLVKLLARKILTSVRRHEIHEMRASASHASLWLRVRHGRASGEFVLRLRSMMGYAAQLWISNHIHLKKKDIGH